MNNMQITGIQDTHDVLRVISFMDSQPQYYPEHRLWLQGKCRERIIAQRYIPIMAISGGEVIGVAVYENQGDGNVEIKNFRIDRSFRDRHLGQFLMRQVEVESDAKKITLDTTVRNFAAVQFFVRNGFNIKGMDELYVPGQSEYLMEKVIIQ